MATQCLEQRYGTRDVPSKLLQFWLVRATDPASGLPRMHAHATDSLPITLRIADLRPQQPTQDCYYTLLVALTHDPKDAGGTEFMDAPLPVVGEGGGSDVRPRTLCAH